MALLKGTRGAIPQNLSKTQLHGRLELERVIGVPWCVETENGIRRKGQGAFLWGWIFPWISDRWGRKPVLLFMALISALVPLTYQAPFLIQHPWLMAFAGFVANGGQGIAALVLVLIPTESVSPQFGGTAIGLATMAGEMKNVEAR